MIVEATNSQIDEKTYAPLVMVKNGVVTHLFSNGVVDFKNIKKLQLPNARYDYMLKLTYYSQSRDGAIYSGSTSSYKIDKRQTSFDVPPTSYQTLYFVEATLITTEI